MAPEAPVAEETPEIIPAAPTLEQAAVAEAAPETLPAAKSPLPQKRLPRLPLPNLSKRLPRTREAAAMKPKAKTASSFLPRISPSKIPLKDRPKDETAGGVQLAEDEDISAFPRRLSQHLR